MKRTLIVDTSPVDAAPASGSANTPRQGTPLPQAVPPSQLPPSRDDALAGALPSWDLLPATPFIRRAK
jgi:hypothetical protein